MSEQPTFPAYRFNTVQEDTFPEDSLRIMKDELQSLAAMFAVLQVTDLRKTSCWNDGNEPLHAFGALGRTVIDDCCNHIQAIQDHFTLLNMGK